MAHPRNNEKQHFVKRRLFLRKFTEIAFNVARGFYLLGPISWHCLPQNSALTEPCKAHESVGVAGAKSRGKQSHEFGPWSSIWPQPLWKYRKMGGGTLCLRKRFQKEIPKMEHRLLYGIVCASWVLSPRPWLMIISTEQRVNKQLDHSWWKTAFFEQLLSF